MGFHLPMTAPSFVISNIYIMKEEKKYQVKKCYSSQTDATSKQELVWTANQFEI